MKAQKEKKLENFKMANEIGLGPALFLMSTKTFAFLFIVLSLLNIQLLMYYVFQTPSIKNSIIIQSQSGKICSNIDYVLV